MNFIELPLPGAYIMELAPQRDSRGWFARTFDQEIFQRIGHTRSFVQFNHSASTFQGTLRGLHYQLPPHGEAKLVRCIRGAVYDVIVDLRKGSPAFLRHVSIELSEENLRALYIPEGFAHGFQTLSDQTQLIYHHTGYYHPASERGLRYNDPRLGIQWPLEPTAVSEKDQTYPWLEADFAGVVVANGQ